MWKYSIQVCKSSVRGDEYFDGTWNGVCRIDFPEFVISLLKYIPGWVDSIGKKKQAPQDTQERKTEVLLSEPEELTEKLTEDVSDDTELIAVIAAAIAAAEGTSTDGFQVGRFEK